MKRIGVVCVVATALSGCVETLPIADTEAANLHLGTADGPARLAAGAEVALASLEGPPDPVQRRFEAAFQREIGARKMTLADPAAARYLVRAYLSAAPAEGATGTAVTFVDDVFDAVGHGRLDRITDTLTLPSTSADAWALVDDRVLDSIASRSADRLAEAIAASPAPHPSATTIVPPRSASLASN